MSRLIRTSTIYREKYLNLWLPLLLWLISCGEHILGSLGGTNLTVPSTPRARSRIGENVPSQVSHLGRNARLSFNVRWMSCTLWQNGKWSPVSTISSNPRQSQECLRLLKFNYLLWIRLVLLTIACFSDEKQCIMNYQINLTCYAWNNSDFV